MAIYSAVPPPPEEGYPTTNTNHPDTSTAPHLETGQTPSRPSGHQATASGSIDIEAWTVSALQSLSVSPIARGTGNPLSIPIDEAARQQASAQAGTPGTTGAQQRTVTIAVDADAARKDPIRRPPSRRDSLRRREALLQGKEGSRQRRRWENDRFIHVPNAQPPLPSDFAPHPTHPVHRVPYHLATFWDRELPANAAASASPSKTGKTTATNNGSNATTASATAKASLRQRHDDKFLAQQARRKKVQMANGSATGLGAAMVPRDLREYAKRSPAVKNWVRYLEEPVRDFVRATNSREAAEARLLRNTRDREDGASSSSDTGVEGLDSEDEEIVFVGRKNLASSGSGRHGWKKARREVGGSMESGVVFDELGDDESAAFKRWLTHSISGYYGLESRSVTTGTPARRVVYVGVNEVMTGANKKQQQQQQPGDMFLRPELPRPLWEVC